MILPPALLNVADRLTAILMTLFEAISLIAITGSTPTFPDYAARILFFRLVHLVHTLIRIDNFGIRAPAKPATNPARIHPAPIAPRAAAQRLPSRPGWLLAALPDIAPTIAADLAALLADPAITALFAAAPTLHRTLRPLLRGLDLTAPQPPPSPRTPPPRIPSPHHPPPRNQAAPPVHGDICRPRLPRRNPLSHPTPSHVQFVTL